LAAAPRVCVVIPTYNHFAYARAAVRSLVRHAPRGATVEHIVVDDCSPEWDAVDWRTWPGGGRRVRFGRRGGLTRSWNAGLRFAFERRSDYVVCTNSDVLFSPGWFEPLVDALESGLDLVGPVSNAPGHAAAQDVRLYLDAPSELDDSARSIGATARALRGKAPLRSRINGFFMMARTGVWRAGRYSRRCVFDPACRMAGNEDELQARWSALGRTAGIATASYIFHYRSVSRPEGLQVRSAAGAYRPGIGVLDAFPPRG